MSQQDLKLLNDAVKDMAENGYPEIDKRRWVGTLNTIYFYILLHNHFPFPVFGPGPGPVHGTESQEI